MTFTAADHPRSPGGTFIEKVQSAPETELLTGHAAASAAGLAPHVAVIFREGETGPAEHGIVSGACEPNAAHPNGGEFLVSLANGGDVIAWWQELELLDGVAGDVAMASMKPSQLVNARILVERAQQAHHDTRRDLERASVDAVKIAFAARFPAGSTVEMFKPFSSLTYTLYRVLDANENVIWLSDGTDTADTDIREINGYLAAGGGRTVAAFPRVNSELGSYLETTI